MDFEIIKNKEGKYGIRLKWTGRVIIPCMYNYKDLSLIEKIERLEDDILILSGIKNGKVSYGLYDSFRNNLITLNYKQILIFSNGIILVDYNNQEIRYKELKEENYEVIEPNLLKENEKYGLSIKNLEIPCLFRKEQLINIGSFKEVLPELYILYDVENKEEIIGFFDKRNNKLEINQFTSYNIINDTLILENKIENKEKHKTKENYVKSKTYITLYNPKYNIYINDKKHVNTELLTYQSNGFSFEGYSSKYIECLKEKNGFFIFNDEILFDSNTGFFEKNAKITLEENRLILFYKDSIKIYDFNLDTWTLYEKAKDGNKNNQFYISSTNPDDIIFRDFNLPNVNIYDDFYVIYTDYIDYKTLIFDKEYNKLLFLNEHLNIEEIYLKLKEFLGIELKKDLTLIKKI